MTQIMQADNGVFYPILTQIAPIYASVEWDQSGLLRCHDAHCNSSKYIAAIDTITSNIIKTATWNVLMYLLQDHFLFQYIFVLRLSFIYINAIVEGFSMNMHILFGQNPHILYIFWNIEKIWVAYQCLVSSKPNIPEHMNLRFPNIVYYWYT